MQNLLDDLTDLLQAEQAFISDGAILKNAVIEAALNMDARLLELLVRRQSFSESVSVFTTEALVRFLFEFMRPRLGAATSVFGLSVS